MADYQYTLTRPRWTVDATGQSHYALPPGAIAIVDLRRFPEQAVAGVETEAYFCTMPDAAVLDDSHHLLARGDCRELIPDAAMLSVWETITGYRPQGDKLVDLLADHLTSGADPAGDDACKPLVPTVAEQLEIHLAGHSRVWNRAFRWASDPHKNRLRDLLRRQFRERFEDGQQLYNDYRTVASGIRGRTWQQVAQSTHPLIEQYRAELTALFNRGLTTTQAADLIDAKADRMRDHARRVLDFWLEKYRLDRRAEGTDWREFVPEDLQVEIAGPLQHETAIAETFNKANSTILGPDLTWSEPGGDNWEVVSNQARRFDRTNNSDDRVAIAASDLSSDDHYSQIDVAGGGSAGGDQGGVAARIASNGLTYYLYFHQYASTSPDNGLRLFKNVSNTFTEIGSVSGQALSVPDTLKLTCDGSSISGAFNGVASHSHTDTAITGNLRCGIYSNRSAAGGTAYLLDNFAAADTAPPSAALANPFRSPVFHSPVFKSGVF